MGITGAASGPRSYYVDATGGNDSNPGSLAAPFQTLSKVNSLTLNPGESVLLKKGQTWKAQNILVPSSGAAGKVITFGAYGTGANPIIDPTSRFTDFTLHSGAIWKRTDTNDPAQVFGDGVRMTWSADVAGLAAGRWCKVAGVVYVWCSDGGNPNSGHTIEYALSAQNLAVDFNGKSYITFDSIDVTKSNTAAYITFSTGTTNFVIKNCTVSWSANRSILIGTNANVTWTYPTDGLIYNVIGHDSLDPDFWIGHCSRVIVENCETYNVGKDYVNKNYSATGTHFPDGILVSAEAIDCVVRHCYVHDMFAGVGLLDERSGGLKSTRTIFERNHVDTSGTSLVAIKIEGDNHICRSNWVNAGTGTAVMLGATTPATPSVLNNTLVSATAAGHSMDTSSQPGLTFKNNIVIRAGATNRYISVAAPAQTNFVASNNLYYGASTGRWFWGPTEYTTLATWQTGSGKDANAVNADPVFVTANTNVHLQTTSPAKFTGVAAGVTLDYDGVTFAAPPSIGCYEYV